MLWGCNRASAKPEAHNGSFYICAGACFFSFAFKYWPIFYNIILSFAKWNFVKDIRWIGLKNYQTMFSKPMFITGLKNTGLYVLALFPFFVMLPLALSALLAEVKSKKASSFYQAVFFMPTMLAFSIICIVWMWIYNPTSGVLNQAIAALGLGEGYSWLSDPKHCVFQHRPCMRLNTSART